MVSVLREVNHSGYICVRRENGINVNTGEQKANIQHYAYDFCDGELVIHAYENIPEIYENPLILGYKFDNTPYLFCLPFGLEKLSPFHSFPYDIRVRPDFIIKEYKKGIMFNEAVISFDELQYFCPSESVVSENEIGDIVFLRSGSMNVKEFDIMLNSINCHIKLNISTKGTVGFARSHMEALTEIRILFPATDNLKFLYNLYQLVDMVFSFICNRRNTTFTSMRLNGIYHDQALREHKIVDCDKWGSCHAFFFDKYREEPEAISIISKTWGAHYLIKNIDNLFRLVAQDIDADIETAGFISINSIHPSVKRRNLIDLQQSLQITGAFEFYVRKYLPSMAEEKDHHRAMKKKLDDVILNPSSSGKLKKLAKSLSSHIICEPALEDKIWKAYNGYKNWLPLKSCISEEWFSEDEIRTLGHEANEWRNELAHSKRTYEPSIDTIRAVRLIEHLNYAIVLRKIGFKDDEIQNILQEILVRTNKPHNLRISTTTSSNEKSQAINEDFDRNKELSNSEDSQ